MDPKCSTILVSFWSLQEDEHLSIPHPEEPSITHFAHRPCIYQHMVRGPISRHRGGSVGVPAVCRALCGLRYLTLWRLSYRGHPHGRLCTTPIVSVYRKCKVHLNILLLSEWTVNIPPFWYRFGACKTTSISRCLTQMSRASLTSRAGLSSTNERSGVPYHIIEVGQLPCLQLVLNDVACFVRLCGLGPSMQTTYKVLQVPGLILLVVNHKLQYLLLLAHFYTDNTFGYALQIIL